MKEDFLTMILFKTLKDIDKDKQEEFEKRFNELYEFIQKYIIQYSFITLCKVFREGKLVEDYSPESLVKVIVNSLKQLDNLKEYDEKFGIDAEAHFLSAIVDTFNENYGTF